jgi:hypothetical protein
LTRKQASGAPTFISCMCCLWALLRAQRKTRKIWYSRYLRPKLALAVGVQGASLTRKLVHLFRINWQENWLVTPFLIRANLLAWTESHFIIPFKKMKMRIFGGNKKIIISKKKVGGFYLAHK